MKRYIPLVLIFVLCFGDISAAEYTKEYKSGNTTIPDYRKISCFGRRQNYKTAGAVQHYKTDYLPNCIQLSGQGL